jgi:hypothetical protein
MEAIAGNVGNGFRADIRDRLRKLSGSAASQLGPRALALATYLATADVLPKASYIVNCWTSFSCKLN